MANVNVTLNSASLQVLDLTTNLFRVNSVVGTVTLAATSAFYDAYFVPATGAGTALTLPSATVWIVWVKNLSVANITVQFQVTGGVLLTQANSPILNPGAVFAYFNASEAAGGIIAVTLAASAGSSPVEVLLAS